MVKIYTEGRAVVILSDLDPRFKPRVPWVEWFLRYEFYDWDNLIMEDDNWCTPGSASLFNIPHRLGYQVFRPSIPLRKVPGCQTRNYISELLMLDNEFVKAIGSKLDNEQVHLKWEKMGQMVTQNK